MILILAFVSFISLYGTSVSVDTEFQPCDAECGKIVHVVKDQLVEDKSTRFNYCRRGCRLLNVIDLTERFENLNETCDLCTKSCKDAYKQEADAAACAVGCLAQRPAIDRRRKQMQDYFNDQTQMLLPLLYVHNIYSNMVDKFGRGVGVSYSYYIQSDNGGLVVIRSVARQDSRPYPASSIDQAVSDTKPSRPVADMDQGPYCDPDSAFHVVCRSPHNQPILAVLFIVAAVVAVVLLANYIASLVNSPDTTPIQKLQVYGDLEYLKVADGADFVSVYKLQDGTQAPPLPLKIKVQDI